MRLLITGGGTGGHVYPLLAVLQQLAAAQSLSLTNDVLYVGRSGSVEERLAASQGLAFSGMRVGGLRGLGPLTQARNLAQLVHAARAAAQVIAQFKPNAFLATGGYVSAPVLWAAWRLEIPGVIELPDLEPGWAIRATWRLSRQVAVSFAEVLRFFPPGRATVTGYPVRAEFYRATQRAGRAHFQLEHDRPVVTVFGGSQGAHALNEAVVKQLPELLELAQLVHISGTRDYTALDARRARLDPRPASHYHLFEYLDQEMPGALAAADVVVARAGAATLGEFPAVGVPSVLVPGRFAAGHQARNAAFLADHGAALPLDEEQLDTALVPTLAELLNDGARLEAMREAARGLAQPHAAEHIGELIEAIAK